MQWQIFVAFLLSVEILAGQTMHLKTREVLAGEMRPQVRAELRRHWQQGRAHYLLQFQTPLNDDIRAALALRGATITGTIPDDAVIVSAGDDFSAEGLDTVFAEEMNPGDKVSPLVGSHGDDSAFIVEFHADVDPDAARALLQSEGITVVEHQDLESADILILASVADVDRLKQWDEIAYVFPAPQEMVNGDRFHNCMGALSSGTVVQQYVRVGHGWSPDATGKVNLGYAFSELTGKVPNAVVEAEVVRAMAEWSKVARVQFVASTNPTALRTISIKFAIRDHSDGFPFDGPGGILAHTFYPSNPEPIAGDLHMDGEEGWHAGTNIDVYTVALHELGHALGLGHSDQPGAIMYPYYRYPSQIGIDDIAGIQAIYGAPAATGIAAQPAIVSAAATPAITVTVQSPATGTLPVNTTAVNAAGLISGATGTVSVSWQTDHAASGRASVTAAGTWSIAAIPTPAGRTTITITAIDAQHRVSSQAVTVVRPTPTHQDTMPPTLTVVAPMGTTVQTSSAALTVSGTASDNVDVVRVTWQNGPLGGGAATGTKAWSVPSIPLLVGTNTIILRAYDAAGNSGWRSVIVIRH